MRDEHAHIDTKSKSLEEAFTRLYRILNILRSPEGCPWDREQTIPTFYKNIIEEAYEYIDAFESKDRENCKEELGDLYLVITMLAIMHEERSEFSLLDSLEETSEKLIRRHPHVFAEAHAGDPDQVVELWDSIKQDVEGKRQKSSSPFKKIPRSLPPLERAYEIQKIAKKQNFDWPDCEGAFKKVSEELSEVLEAIEKKDQEHIEQELGDLLFSVVNASRLVKVNPFIALHKTNEKFVLRYRRMVELYEQQEDLPFDQADLETMDSYWEKAKELE